VSHIRGAFPSASHTGSPGSAALHGVRSTSGVPWVEWDGRFLFDSGLAGRESISNRIANRRNSRPEAGAARRPR